MYSVQGVPFLNPTILTPSQGDPRAARLLECLAFTDRVSDYTIDFGDNTSSTLLNGINMGDRGISKLRIPGLLNVNTASPGSFIATIPSLFPNTAQNKTVLSAIFYAILVLKNDGTDPRLPPPLLTTGKSLYLWILAARRSIPDMAYDHWENWRFQWLSRLQMGGATPKSTL